jgi:hypothetical protein
LMVIALKQPVEILKVRCALFAIKSIHIKIDKTILE